MVPVHRSDADTIAPVRVVGRARLGVDRVQRVVLNKDTADATVRVARLEVVALLVEDLEAVIAAVCDPEPTLRIEGQRVRSPELTVPDADLAPLFDEGPVCRVLQNPGGAS